VSFAPQELSSPTPPVPEPPLAVAAPEPELVTQDPNEDLTPPSPARLNAARLAIIASIALTLCALTLVFYRSYAVVEPTSAVIIYGDPTLDGAEIFVRPDVLSPDFPAARATLSADNNYQTPILLRPGNYWITITHKGQVRPLLQTRFTVLAYSGQQYFLGQAAINAMGLKGKPAPATRPASAD
jgi:hypothetical protein